MRNQHEADQGLRIAVTGLRGIPATWGGVEHHCEQMYARLAAKGHHVVVYGRKSYVKKWIRRYKGVCIRRLPTIGTKYLEALVHTFLAVVDILIRNPDIIHIHAQGPAVFSWLPRVFRPGMRVFFTCHGKDWQRRKWPAWASWLISIGERCSAVFPHYRVVVSRTLQDYYRTTYGVRTHLIPNGIQPPVSGALRMIRALGLTPKGYLLHVGRIVPEKRLDDVLSAFSRHPRKFDLVVVGDSGTPTPYTKGIKDRVAACANIHHLGFQFGEALAELYANARAFVTASDLEGFPLTILEAMAHGLPVLASDIPPHREILSRTHPLFFPCGHVEELSDLMDRLETLADSELRRLGSDAREWVVRTYNWDDYADNLESLYHESVRSREVRTAPVYRRDGGR